MSSVFATFTDSLLKFFLTLFISFTIASFLNTLLAISSDAEIVDAREEPTPLIFAMSLGFIMARSTRVLEDKILLAMVQKENLSFLF